MRSRPRTSRVERCPILSAQNVPAGCLPTPGRQLYGDGSSVPAGKVNSRWPSVSMTGSPVSRCAPTDMKPSWLVSKASSLKPASSNQDRIAGVRSGGLRCLVQRTSASRAHRSESRHRGLDVALGDVPEDAACHHYLGGYCACGRLQRLVQSPHAQSACQMSSVQCRQAPSIRPERVFIRKLLVCGEDM
jgi:hypothetical protein